MEVVLIETKKGNGYKVVVDGKWLYTSRRELFRAVFKHQGCTFREIEQESN